MPPGALDACWALWMPNVNLLVLGSTLGTLEACSTPAVSVFPTGPAADGPMARRRAAGRIGQARLAVAVAQAGRILPLHGPGGPQAHRRPTGGP